MYYNKKFKEKAMSLFGETESKTVGKAIRDIVLHALRLGKDISKFGSNALPAAASGKRTVYNTNGGLE